MSGKPTTKLAIFELVKAHGSITSAEVTKMIGKDSVRSLMARMSKDGALITSGERRCYTYSLGVLKTVKPVLMDRAKPSAHNPDCSHKRTSKAKWSADTPAQTTSKTIYTYGKPMQQPTRTNTHSFWG